MTATSQAQSSHPGHGADGAPWRDRNIDDTHGGRSVRVREFEARCDSPHDAFLVWLHGGSWTSGSIESWTTALGRLARELPCRLVAVAYRLAPHPAAVEDVALVARSLREACPGATILVGGDSAGATIAASAAVALGRDVVDGQVLLYPPTDPDCTRLHDHCFPTRRHMQAAWSAYAGPRPVSHDTPVTPLLAPLGDDTPPAALIVGSADPLIHDVAALARRLRRAGVPVRVRVLPDIGHGALLHPPGPVFGAVLDAVTHETGLLVPGGDDA